MAVTREQVAELYVAFFERAPDADGLDYWVATELPIEDISQSFFDQPETQAKYPDTMDNATFIDTIYQNVFDRSADAAGAVYWSKELDSGNISRANMILAVVNGAQDTEISKDDTILANKTTVGVDFADNGLNDTTQAKDVMSGVDETKESVTEAKEKTDAYAEETFKYKLTAGLDNIEASSQDDLIKGVISPTVGVATLTDGDVIDGKEGNDTVSFSIPGAAAVPGLANIETTITNVENVEFRGDMFNSTVNAENWTEVEKYTLNSQSAGATLNNVSSSFKSIELVRGGGVTTTVNLKDSLADSTVAVKVASSSAINTLDISDGAVEHFKVTSSSNSSAAGFTTSATATNDTNLVDITVDGDSPITINTTTGAVNLEKVDASALEGALTTGAALNALSNDMKIMGGTGANTILITGNGDNAITTQAGADVISSGNGDNKISSGDANDSIVLGSGNNTITTGSGDGHITVTTGNNTITTGDGNYNLAAGAGGAAGATLGTNGLIIGNGNNTITTGAGIDVVQLGTGKNTVITNAGNDIVQFGGSGSLDTGAGDDTITGAFAGTSSSNKATLNAGAGNDSITVSGGFVEISEASGTDTLVASGGSVTVKAGTYSSIGTTGGSIDTSSMSNNFTISVNGGTVKTGAGEDTITFGANGGTVDAGSGADVITAGASTDTIDYTKFNASSNILSGTSVATMDVISGFTSGTDKLKIGVANVDDTNADNDGSGAAVADYTAALASANGIMNGTIIYVAENDGTNTYVFYDSDANGTADMAITLAGVITLADGDISA